MGRTIEYNIVKTTVIMATYNGEKFIKGQLESIRNQTKKPDYVIIRDDKSTDDTVNEIQKFIATNQLKNWQVIVNENNKGFRLNFRQLMLDALTTDADYIFFSDQDDNWLPQKIERQLTGFEQFPKAELISSDYDIKIIGEGQLSVGTLYTFSETETISQYPFDMKRNRIFRLGWTNAITRNLAQQTLDIWKESVDDVSHDTLISMFASNAMVAYNLNESLGTHVRHGGNASGSNYFSLSSSHQKHLDELQRDMHCFQLTYQFAKINHTLHVAEAKIMSDFYEKRFENAKKRKFFATIYQIIHDRKRYFDYKGPIRDILFIFKK